MRPGFRTDPREVLSTNDARTLFVRCLNLDDSWNGVADCSQSLPTE